MLALFSFRPRPSPLAARNALALLTLLAVSGGAARAQSATYTFEAPVFTAGQTTPLLNVAPNSGDASFRASFTSAPTAGGFQVSSFVPNPLFSGNGLFDPAFDNQRNEKLH